MEKFGLLRRRTSFPVHDIHGNVAPAVHHEKQWQKWRGKTKDDLPEEDEADIYVAQKEQARKNREEEVRGCHKCRESPQSVPFKVLGLQEKR